jgi:hypothetical protein
MVTAGHIKAINKGGVHRGILYFVIFFLLAKQIDINMAAIVSLRLKNSIIKLHLKSGNLIKIFPAVVPERTVDGVDMDNLRRRDRGVQQKQKKA